MKARSTSIVLTPLVPALSPLSGLTQPVLHPSSTPSSSTLSISPTLSPSSATSETATERRTPPAELATFLPEKTSFEAPDETNQTNQTKASQRPTKNLICNQAYSHRVRRRPLPQSATIMTKTRVGAAVATRTESNLRFCQMCDDGSITIRVSCKDGTMERLENQLRTDYPFCNVDVKASGLTGELLATLSVPSPSVELQRAKIVARKRGILSLVECVGVSLLLTAIILYLHTLVRIGFEGE